jgi:hypothetical protein
LVALSLTIAARIAAGNQAWGTAVRLQASAESIFATTGFVLYDADRQVVDEMLLAARESLGSLFDSAEADGRSLDLPAAVAKATEVLDAAGHGSNVPR